MRKQTTVRPTRKSTIRENVTLETFPMDQQFTSSADGIARTKAPVIGKITPRGKDLSWLASDVFSTDSGYRS